MICYLPGIANVFYVQMLTRFTRTSSFLSGLSSVYLTHHFWRFRKYGLLGAVLRLPARPDRHRKHKNTLFSANSVLLDRHTQDLFMNLANPAPFGIIQVITCYMLPLRWLLHSPKYRTPDTRRPGHIPPQVHYTRPPATRFVLQIRFYWTLRHLLFG